MPIVGNQTNAGVVTSGVTGCTLILELRPIHRGQCSLIQQPIKVVQQRSAGCVVILDSAYWIVAARIGVELVQVHSCRVELGILRQLRSDSTGPTVRMEGIHAHWKVMGV